jgi:hypothetical protein
MAGVFSARNSEQFAIALDAGVADNIKAARRAAYNTGKRLRTQASTLIRAEVPLKKSYVDSQLKVERTDENTVMLRAQKRGALITAFPHRRAYSGRYKTREGKRPAGIKVKLTTDGGYTHFSRVWIRSNNGTDIPMERIGSGRYPIRAVYSQSVSQVLRGLLDELSRIAPGLYRTELARASRTER